MQFYAFNDGGQTFYVQGSNPMNALAALRNWLQSRGWGATDVASVSERDLQPVSEQGVNKGYLVNANQTVTAGGGQEKFSFGGGSSGGKGASASFEPTAGGNPFGSYLAEDKPYGEQGAYRRALQGKGVKFDNIAGRSLLDDQSRYQAPFTLLQAAGLKEAGEPDAFYSYVGGSNNPYELGKDAFRQIYGASRGTTEELDPRLQEFKAPKTTAGYSNAIDAARGAVGRSGRFLTDDMFDDLRGEYVARPSTETTDFLDFLKRRLRIQGA